MNDRRAFNVRFKFNAYHKSISSILVTIGSVWWVYEMFLGRPYNKIDSIEAYEGFYIGRLKEGISE